MRIALAVLLGVAFYYAWRRRRVPRDFHRRPMLTRIPLPFLASNYTLLRGLLAGLYIVASKKREGKSYMIVLACALELVFGKKQVVMYMPGVNKQGMADLVASLGGSRFSVWERLHLLERDEALFWWRYRGTWVAKWELVSVIQGSAKFKPINYRAHGDCGVMYGLDELAKLTPKTATGENWQEMTAYLDMMSKIPDVILGSTVTFKHLVADLRVKVDVLIRCWNLSRLQRLGIRFCSGFFSVWKENPEHYSGAKVPTITWSFTPVDRNVYAAYDTAAGDTMIGGVADIGERSKGLHIGWVALIALVCLCALGAIPIKGVGVAHWMLGLITGQVAPAPQHVGGQTNAVQAVVTNAAVGARIMDWRPSRVVEVASAAGVRPLAQTEHVRILNYTEVRGNRVFYLADGRPPLWNPAGTWDGHYLRLRTGETCYFP